jgi:hypothetical protein
MTPDLLLAAPAASLLEAFQHYWPLAVFALAVLFAAQALLIGDQPWARHFGEFVGGATNLRWIFVVLCSALAIGMLGFTWWQSFRTIGPPFEQALYERGIHAPELIELINHAATPKVIDIQERHAAQFGQPGGAQTIAELSRRIWSDIVNGEETDQIPSGSVAFYLDEVHGRLAEQELRGGGLWSGWQDEIARWRRLDPYDYASGPNPAIVVNKKPRVDESALQWEQKKTTFYPVLADNSALTAPRESVNVTRDGVVVAWGGNFSYYFASLDSEKGKLVPVTKAEVETFPVSPDQFQQVAFDNLRARILAGIGTERNLMESGGRSITFGLEFGGNAASILLLPDLYEVMQNYVDGAFVVVAPNEELFTVAEVVTRDRRSGSVMFNGDFLATVGDLLEAGKTANAAKAFASAVPLLVTPRGMTVYRPHPTSLPDGVTAYE